MSKKSRRRNKLLLAGAALFGASKLGMLGGKGTVTGAAGKNKRLFTDIKPKKFTKPVGPQKVNVVKKTPPGKTVNFKGEVIEKGVNKGVGNKNTKFINRSPEKGEVGIYQGGKKVSDLNQKAINVLSDGKIQSQGKTFEGKKEYRKFMDEKRAKQRNTSGGGGFKKFMNKFVLGEKTQMKMGKMVKARGGGMARTKPTKMY